MFVVTHEPIVSSTEQPQKKGVSPDTQKNKIKPVKDVLSVNLSPAPPVTNDLSAAEGVVGVKPAKMLARMGSECFESPNMQNKYEFMNMRIPQEHLPGGDIAFPPPKASSEKCQNTVISGFLQPSVPCSKAQPKLNLRRQYFK